MASVAPDLHTGRSIMLNLKTLLATMVAAVISTSAIAGGSLKDDAAPEELRFNWSGLYVGTSVGVATGNTQDRADILGLITVGTDYDISGAVYGGHVGYNHQVGGYVFGVEGSYSAGDINGSQTCLLLLNCARKIDAIGSLVGRFGYAMDRTMIYSSLGVAWADVETKVTDNILGGGLASLRGDETHVGWVAGFGIEHALARNVLARLEFNHYDFGSETHNLGLNVLGIATGVTIPSKVDVEINTLRVGASIKLN